MRIEKNKIVKVYCLELWYMYYIPLTYSIILLFSNLLHSFVTCDCVTLTCDCDCDMWQSYILNNISHITFFPATNGNFVIKFTIKYIYSFSSTLLNFNFPTHVSVLFFILWYISQLSIYFPTSFVTPNH